MGSNNSKERNQFTLKNEENLTLDIDNDMNRNQLIKYQGQRNKLLDTQSFFTLISYLNPKDIYNFVQVNKEFRYNQEILILQDLNTFIKKFNQKFTGKLAISGFSFEYARIKLANGFNQNFQVVMVFDVLNLPRSLVNICVNQTHLKTRSLENYLNKSVQKNYKKDQSTPLNISLNYKFLCTGKDNCTLDTWICVDDTHAYLNLKDRQRQKSAQKQGLKWVNRKDRVELALNYFNTNMGFVNFNSFTFKESQVNPVDQDTIATTECDLELQTMKNWYTKDHQFREIYTFEYEDLSPCFELVEQKQGSIDNIIGKFTQRAIQPGFLKKKFKIGFNLVVKEAYQSITHEVNRENLAIDRERPLELRVGEILILQAIRAGNIQ